MCCAVCSPANGCLVLTISLIKQHCSSSLPPSSSKLQLKLSHAALEVQKQVAEQQREEAVATVLDLEAQLAEIGAEIATHMQVSVWVEVLAGGAAAFFTLNTRLLVYSRQITPFLTLSY